jgi:hypothetical protein
MPKEALGNETICIYVQNRGETRSAYRWKATGQTRIGERALKVFVFRINILLPVIHRFPVGFFVLVGPVHNMRLRRLLLSVVAHAQFDMAFESLK